MNENRILRFRRWQIRAVAIGTLGATVLLAGAVLDSAWLFIGGGAVFVVALAAIFALGAANLWTAVPARRDRRFGSHTVTEAKRPVDSGSGKLD